MPSWREFWDSAHSIYVNERHKDVHYRDVAEQLADFVPRPDACVLDHGSGEAIHADLVAARARELYLCDAAASVRAANAAHFAGNTKIKVIAPEDVERLPEGSLDLVFANSLVQYLTAAELDRLLGVWRRLLAPGGMLIVADMIPPDVGAISDGLALLRYAATQWIFRRCRHRPRPHGSFALPPAAQRTRHRALQRGRIYRKAARRRLFGASACRRMSSTIRPA